MATPPANSTTADKQKMLISNKNKKPEKLHNTILRLVIASSVRKGWSLQEKADSDEFR